MKQSKFMIQDYPELIKYFASRNPLHLLIYVLPLMVFFLALGLEGESSVFAVSGLILVGAFYWTFLEYVIHRFLYHSNFRARFLRYFIGSFHAYHHENMSDHRVLTAGLFMVYFVTPTVLLPLWFFTPDWQSLGAIGAGLAGGHYFYEWVHYSLHYKKFDSGYLNYIQKYHFYHHDKAPMKNFGNTSHFWDVIFGTYDKSYKTYEMSILTQKTLITDKAKVQVIHA